MLQNVTAIKRPNNDNIIEAFRANLGIKSKVCEALEIARPTLDRWIAEDEGLKEAIQAQGEEAVDFVESKLFELIEGVTVQEIVKGKPVIYTQPPNVTACIFYLKTKGKSRGYVERQEFTGKDGKELLPITGMKIV